jgi:hypothetical protein
MNPSAPTRIGKLWKRLKLTAVIAFVFWNLVFLAYRNIADLWGESLIRWSSERIDYKRLEPGIDRFSETTKRYAGFMGIEQGWSMFASPMARNAPFPALQIEFEDGSEELVLSANEPDPERFLRWGGWRQRKLEDTIASAAADKACTGKEAAVWSSFTLWMFQNWQLVHPDDARDVKQLVLLRRRIEFCEPGQSRRRDPPESSVIARYAIDGRRLQ